MFWTSWLHFGSQVGIKLATFSIKMGEPVACHPLFCCVRVFLRFVRRLDPILAPFWLHFEASGPHLGSILEVFGSMLAPFLAPWLQFLRYFWCHILGCVCRCLKSHAAVSVKSRTDPGRPLREDIPASLEARGKGPTGQLAWRQGYLHYEHSTGARGMVADFLEIYRGELMRIESYDCLDDES